jgi:cell shape-determining protein MreD
MHERYLYPFIPFIAVIIGESPLVACLAAVASVGLFLDINFVQTWSPLLTPFVSTATDGIFWSFVFIIMFAVLLRWYLRRAMEAKKAAAVTGE